MTTLRAFFRGHAAGVVIITAQTRHGPVGFTASSLASVSVVPPMISFNVSRGSSSWAALGTSTHVAVHRLTAGQADLADRFARSGVARFEGVSWSTGAHGVPLLRGPSSWLVASISHRLEVGDSTVLIAEVRHVEVAPSERRTETGDPVPRPVQHRPLVYATGGYASILPLTTR